MYIVLRRSSYYCLLEDTLRYSCLSNRIDLIADELLDRNARSPAIRRSAFRLSAHLYCKRDSSRRLPGCSTRSHVPFRKDRKMLNGRKKSVP